MTVVSGSFISSSSNVSSFSKYWTNHDSSSGLLSVILRPLLHNFSFSSGTVSLLMLFGSLLSLLFITFKLTMFVFQSLSCLYTHVVRLDRSHLHGGHEHGRTAVCRLHLLAVTSLESPYSWYSYWILGIGAISEIDSRSVYIIYWFPEDVKFAYSSVCSVPNAIKVRFFFKAVFWNTFRLLSPHTLSTFYSTVLVHSSQDLELA